MSEKATVLIVEDKKDVLQINARLLRRRGHTVLTASCVKDCLDALSKTTPDMLILDIMLPDGSGYDICSAFRQKSDNPVMFLSGKDEIKDKVEGLERGGDYYLTKPYSFDELITVAERLLSRHLKQEERVRLTKGNLTLDLSENKAYVRGKDVCLTAKEFLLLLTLVRNENKIFSPAELYETVWGVPSGADTRTVRFHIANLKKKIDTENAGEYDIVSVYGKGYMFTP